MSKAADGLLRELEHMGLIDSSFKNNEQQLSISDKGEDIRKVLTWFRGMSVNCPECGIESLDVTSYLSKDVRKTSVLCHCKDCDIIWGRTNV